MGTERCGRCTKRSDCLAHSPAVPVEWWVRGGTHLPVYDRAEQARLLNQDLYGEHDAILHYLQHAWILAETYGPAIESIARDEMRHLKWLAHTIVRLGQTPDLTPPPIVPPKSGRDLFMQDIAAEEAAIGQYVDHQAVMGDIQIQGLLGRILIDEQDHRRQFSDMLMHLPDGSWQEHTGEDPDPVASRLQAIVALEYQAVLQSLWQSFLHHHTGSISADWEERAIDEMKHLGWIGEALARHGAVAEFPRTPTVRSTPARQEEEEARQYESLAVWADGHDPALLPLIERIRLREAYQRTTLGRMGNGFTLGPVPRDG